MSQRAPVAHFFAARKSAVGSGRDPSPPSKYCLEGEACPNEGAFPFRFSFCGFKRDTYFFFLLGHACPPRLPQACPCNAGSAQPGELCLVMNDAVAVALKDVAPSDTAG